MPKYVRRQPFTERVKALLNPYDFLLWLSEEIESNGWDQLEKAWAIPIAISLNLTFVVARANVRYESKGYDDVFGDRTSSGWLAWLATFTVHVLTVLSLINAWYTFARRKHYRLFEAPIDDIPSTPSAKRVHVNSSPAASSPLRFLTSILGAEAARSRAHPDPVRDVWEIAVWDPLPISLHLFSYFSPGHVIIYWLFLPTLPTDSRPSVTVITSLFLAGLFSAQLSLLQSNFSRLSQDSTLISKEVLNEYDTKYVRPRTQPLYRDVSTQFSEQAAWSEGHDARYNKVETYTPMVVINRGFKPNPNPNYLAHVDSEVKNRHIQHQLSTPLLRPGSRPTDISSPVRQPTPVRQPLFKPSGDGGSLGVYSHAASPLKKSASVNFSPSKSAYLNGVSRERAGLSPDPYVPSSQKRLSVPPEGISTALASQRWGHLKPKPDKARRVSGKF